MVSSLEQQQSCEKSSEEAVSRARATAADARLHMAHRIAQRAPRAPDWTSKQAFNDDENRMNKYKEQAQRRPQPDNQTFLMKSNNSLECYSPKYHHIRPQPKGREAQSFQRVPPSKGFYARSDCLNQNVMLNVGGGGAVVGGVVQQQQQFAGSVRGVADGKVPGKLVAVPAVSVGAASVGHYSESQFSYRVNGLPGNAAQASAAAAFFARLVFYLFDG